ncbi:epidermal growth factor-like protein 7 isoform X3 [Mauremys reevesii]|uniref:epidermal growth factor-like protein 7 isoform X3 n=1 Tax=Mauremys reevesii TaxID=260615 RepID=UPI00193F25D7|nr:epidermal growth factor-like protein 7 isoform X3 [Mauremys reevesii]
MQRISCLLTGFVLILGVTSAERFARSGRRVCSAEMQNRAASYVESHVQPVYQPYLTTCQGHRLCSTYRTTYKVAYRLAYRRFSQPIYMCCPGWRRANGHAVGCSKAICRLPCQNGGSCSAPDRCTCPPGWMGKSCQTGREREPCTGRVPGPWAERVTPGSVSCQSVFTGTQCVYPTRETSCVVPPFHALGQPRDTWALPPQGISSAPDACNGPASCCPCPCAFTSGQGRCLCKSPSLLAGR